MNIYVGNLSFNATDEDLREVFEQHGGVESAKIIMDSYSGKSRGFGFVEMPDASEAQAAISGLDVQEIMGRALRVDEARPRRQGGRGRGYNNDDDGSW